MRISVVERLTSSAKVEPRTSSVLVVNDSPEQLALMKMVLEDAGYDVSTAVDGYDGVASARAIRPDAILSDVVMPRMDGFELCRLIRATPELASTPLLLISALATDSGSAVAGIQAGADDYLECPFDPMRLVSRVARLIERGRAEEILRRQLDFTRAITTSLGEGVLAFDRDRRVTFINPAAESALGWTAEEALKNQIEQLLPLAVPAGAAEARLDRALTAALRFGATARVEDGRFRRKDGSTVPVAYSCSPIRTGGEIDGGVLIFHDITERAEAEQRLETSERRYRDLVENLNDVVFSLRTDGVIQYVSPAAQKYGYEPAALNGKHFSIMVHPDDLPAVERSLLQAAAGAVEPLEFRAVDREGRVRYARVSSRALLEDGRPAGITGVIIDVTEQRRAEEQLRTSQRLEAVGRLAGGIAHDFNNLLVAIIGYAEFAIDGVREGDPLRRDLREIIKAGERAAALTRQLLAFSRKQVLKPQELDLNEVLRGMEPMLRRLIGEDIDFQTIYASRPALVLADPGQMEQVIMNLAVNARDAMPTGGNLGIGLSVDSCRADGAGYFEPGECVAIAVTDSGCGMDEATKAQIFEPFFSTKGPGEGTGLGLATVHGIVAQSGGRIAVDSAPGQGTTFRVAFPRLVASGQKTAPRAEPAAVGVGKGTILLVEDEAAVREVARRSLKAAGFTVLTAADPNHALTICQHHDVGLDLLLTDVVMPAMSGRALWESVRQYRPDMPVLYMSGYSGTAIAQHGVLAEGTHLIEKPFNGAALVGRVRGILEGRRGSAATATAART
jgi:PAS domain S-box-containing protein